MAAAAATTRGVRVAPKAANALLDSLRDAAVDGEATHVRVVVRIRPMLAREREGGEKGSLEVSGSQVTLRQDGGEPLRFTYDHVLGERADQQAVFAACAADLAERFAAGFNACVFCYGQTASGKTYTMYGAPGTPGLALLAARRALECVGAKKKTHEVRVSATLLEIYQEKLRDLLAPAKGGGGGGGGDAGDEVVRIREDPQGGVFVEGLAERAVAGEEDVAALVREACEHRTVGSTRMNEQSSRSHCVLSLALRCTEKGDAEGVTEVRSQLHLVDLAGSERQESTGATGARLKEGANINQSLSALGNVISALVERRAHVPYRNSKLTRLLQSSLGGNSFTVMVANCSPARVAAAETASTLRFADRAKQIRNQPVVNEDPRARKLRELRAEVERLRGLLSACPACHRALRLACPHCRAPVGLAGGGDAEAEAGRCGGKCVVM